MDQLKGKVQLLGPVSGWLDFFSLLLKDLTFRYCLSALEFSRLAIFWLIALLESPCLYKNTILFLPNLCLWNFSKILLEK